METNDYYMNIAKAVSEKSTCLKKHYGAVIVNNSEIISTGYNGAPRGEPHCTVCTKTGHGKDLSTYCECSAVHAEMNAIISASRKEMLGGTLYLAGIDAETGEEISAMPCEVCLRLIKNAGIDTVINRDGVIYSRVKGILQKAEDISVSTTEFGMLFCMKCAHWRESAYAMPCSACKRNNPNNAQDFFVLAARY